MSSRLFCATLTSLDPLIERHTIIMQRPSGAEERPDNNIDLDGNHNRQTRTVYTHCY
jgi:hypothetical protein